MTEAVPLEITVEDYDAMRRDGAKHTLLDVREPKEFAISALDGSLDIPMGDVPGRVDDLPRNETGGFILPEVGVTGFGTFTPVPEPAVGLLLGLGLLFLPWGLRSRIGKVCAHRSHEHAVAGKPLCGVG